MARAGESARPRLVATDLDGTLLRSDGTLSGRTRQAISAAEDAGVTVVFVTARPPRRLDEFADVVGPHGIALCANGAFVYDVAAGAVTEHTSIARDVLEEIIEDLRAAIPQIVFAVERADGMGREERFRSVWGSHEGVVDGLAELTSEPVGKLLGRCDAMDPDEFHARVAAVLDGRVELGYSGAVGLAEITAGGVTKAAGLARWCERHGIEPAAAWAFGDMPNDLPMLAWAGRSHAVANAHRDVLTAVDLVVPSNDDDGVAVTLETLGRA